MKKFTVSIGQVKKANQAIINSNKLKNVFYNIGNKFLCNPEDFSDICEILDRKMIKVKA
jgi:FixJ family two-component response regulator